MSRSTHLIARVLWVFCTVLFALCLTVGAALRDEPGTEVLKYEVHPVSPEQQSSAQLRLIETRAAAENKLVCHVATAFVVMFLFGAFCAIWARNCQRNTILWFLSGFVFHVFAVLAILLWYNPQNRFRRRCRQLPTFWPMAKG